MQFWLGRALFRAVGLQESPHFSWHILEPKKRSVPRKILTVLLFRFDRFVPKSFESNYVPNTISFVGKICISYFLVSINIHNTYNYNNYQDNEQQLHSSEIAASDLVILCACYIRASEHSISPSIRETHRIRYILGSHRTRPRYPHQPGTPTIRASTRRYKTRETIYYPAISLSGTRQYGNISPRERLEMLPV